MVKTSKVIAAFFHCSSNPQMRDERSGADFGWSSILFSSGRWIPGMLILLTIVGCMKPIGGKALPAPIRETVKYEAIGKMRRVWGGDHFEFGDSNQLHYVSIRGVDCPKPGQEFYSESWRTTRKIARGKDVRIEVVDRDESMVEIADVFLVNQDAADIEGDLNLGLELIRLGLGWFDGTEFENSDLFKQAEEEARTKKIGLWSEADPVPPWEFESARQKNRAEQLQF